MKIELETSDIERIVEMVVERFKPLLNNTNNSKGDELMDKEGLQAYLGMKKTWVNDKVHKREIPFCKPGKFVRFRKKHIDLWMVNPYHHELDIYNLKLNGKAVKK